MNMKVYLLILLAFFLLTNISCQKIEDNEKEAIKAVIEEATNAYKTRNYDRMAAIWVQDESIVRLNSGNYGYFYNSGWRNIGSAYKELFKENPEAITNKYEKANFKIEIHKKTAWVVHDELIYDSENEYQYTQIGIHLLVKREGDWKIIYLSYVDTSSYEEKSESDQN